MEPAFQLVVLDQGDDRAAEATSGQARSGCAVPHRTFDQPVHRGDGHVVIVALRGMALDHQQPERDRVAGIESGGSGQNTRILAADMSRPSVQRFRQPLDPRIVGRDCTQARNVQKPCSGTTLLQPLPIATVLELV